MDQVKEKYGSLQFDFYFKGGYAEKEYQTIIGEIVNAYENKSDTICERCGKTGELRERNGWFSVLCDDCFNLGDF